MRSTIESKQMMVQTWQVLTWHAASLRKPKSEPETTPTKSVTDGNKKGIALQK